MSCVGAETWINSHLIELGGRVGTPEALGATCQCCWRHCQGQGQAVSEETTLEVGYLRRGVHHGAGFSSACVSAPHVQLCATLCLLRPWASPGRHTGVGCYFLLQGIFSTQGWNPHLLHLLHCQVDPLPLSHLGSPGPAVSFPLYGAE